MIDQPRGWLAAGVVTACVASGALAGGAWERHAATTGAVPVARAQGYQQGYHQGLDEGMAERQATYKERYDLGYETGYRKASQDANDAYDEGYADAQAVFEEDSKAYEPQPLWSGNQPDPGLPLRTARPQGRQERPPSTGVILVTEPTWTPTTTAWDASSEAVGDSQTIGIR